MIFECYKVLYLFIINFCYCLSGFIWVKLDELLIKKFLIVFNKVVFF